MKQVASFLDQARTLADFDLEDSAALAQIVADAHVAMQAVSPFAPRNARGTVFYINFVAELRKHLVAKGTGWTCATDGGIEFVENRERGIRIGYLSAEFDPGAPCDLKSRRRGPSSEVIAKRNSQLCFYFYSAEAAQKRPRGLESWFVAVARCPQSYRLELVLPVEYKNGRIETWAARILIAEVPFDTEPRLPDTETTQVPEEEKKPRARRKKRKSDEGRSGTDG